MMAAIVSAKKRVQGSSRAGRSPLAIVRMPATTIIESPGRKKPKSRPVSAKTMSVMTGTPPILIISSTFDIDWRAALRVLNQLSMRPLRKDAADWQSPLKEWPFPVTVDASHVA